MHFALIGLMGSGKTTVGERLARRLRSPFYDTDSFIEQQTGYTIHELFERHGEEGFRDIESESLQTLLSQPPGIIATGGGIVLRERNRQCLRQNAWLIYLKAQPNTLATRLRNATDRPLLKGEDVEAKLSVLLTERAPYYETCDWVVETDKRSPSQVVKHLQALLQPDIEKPLQLPIEISNARSYNIFIAPHLLSCYPDAIQVCVPPNHDFILTHPKLRFRASMIETARSLRGSSVDCFEVPPGEKTKTLAWAQKVYLALMKARADRSTTLFALGGGVIGDLGGFVAATYMRGIDYVQIPTTLLAQVDASIGGKVGVDLPFGKNLVGAFHHPKAVMIDPSVLETLPTRHIHNGFAEILKYGIALNRGLWLRLQTYIQQGAVHERRIKFQETDWMMMIAACASIKAEIVAADERDLSGKRAVLNFGHTVGHAIEVALGYQGWLHGEAVAVGMVIEAEIGKRLGITPPGVVEELKTTIHGYGLPTQLPEISSQILMAAMRLDKKNESGKLNMVLLKATGKAELIREIPENVVQEVLWQYGSS